MKLVYVGELERTPDSPDHKGIRQGLERLGVDYIIADPILYPDRVVETCDEFKPDLVVHGNTDSLDREWAREIKARQVFFMGDVQPRIEDYPNWGNWIRNAGCFEALFLSNRDQLGLWSEAFRAPAYFWPHGCYVPDRLEVGEEFHDLLFIGAMDNRGNYRKRFDLINGINELHPVDLLTENDREGRNGVWRRMPKLYHTANFVLDVSHFWDIDGYASGRYWYSGGLGACSLTKRFPGCEEFYEDKIHKLYFDTPEEAGELIGFYSKHPELRQRIKFAAYEHNRERHNYSIRFREMFDKLNMII